MLILFYFYQCLNYKNTSKTVINLKIILQLVYIKQNNYNCVKIYVMF